MMKVQERWVREQVFRSEGVPIYVMTAYHRRAVLPHDHEFMEIVLVLAGRAEHVTRGGTGVIREGDVLVMRPGVWHAYEKPEGFRIYNCCFGPELLRRELAWTLEDAVLSGLFWGQRDQESGVVSLRVKREGLGECRGKLDELGRAVRLGVAGRGIQIGGLLMFLGTLARYAQVHGEAKPREMPAVVVGAVRKLEGAVGHPWQMAELAEQVGVDAAYLTRRFKQAVGLPPMAYLARCRAEKAALLLARTDRAVGQIAREVGWEDPVYFARRFRKHFGMTAGEYRERFGRGQHGK